MNVVVPMAGRSRRFAQLGYRRPKAFLDIDGRPMIQWVCQMFSPQDRFIFVCQREHAEDPEYRSLLRGAAADSEIIGIEPHDRGPVYSAAQAHAVMKPEDPVVISYCDLYQHWRYDRFLMKMQDYAGGLAVFRGFHPASFGTTLYAYVRTDEDGDVAELREKACFTDRRHEEYASTGVYYFKSWWLFKKYAAELLRGGESPPGTEAYVSLLYNLMVRDALRVGLYEVDRFICWGTPEDVEQYVFWSEFFGRDLANIRARLLQS